MAKGAMPVLVGVGQSMSQWDGKSGPDGAPSPLSLARDASRAALADAGIAASELDLIAFVRIFEDSVRNAPHPHGHNTNLPGTLARDLGAAPKHLIYSGVGGQSPQSLANEMANRIHAGEIEAALITGSEANRASKGAMRNKVEINWADESDLAYEDRGMGDMLLSRGEIKHGLVAPAFFYAMFENAIAAREGRTRTGQREAMAKLFQPFTEVAAKNPYAQFPTARTEDFLKTPSKENYEFSDPFLKWHIAQDAVNQGASAIILSEDRADALGIPKDKRIYLHGGGEASDDFISERPRLDGSWAMEEAITRALDMAGKSNEDIRHLDIYSCFPCAVQSAAQALGIDPMTDKRPLTLTGGLPFFGGPGNNYSMHGIAEMAAALRADPGSYGLVLANGGWMTKEAAGMWSSERPQEYHPVASTAYPAEKVALDDAPSGGTIETYTVVHGREGPAHGIIFGRSDDGKRFIAVAAPDALQRLRDDANPAGARVSVETEGEKNTFRFA